jgi:hypothetical protein
MLEIDKLRSETIHYKELCLKLYTALNTVVERKPVKGFENCNTLTALAGNKELICKALLDYEYNKLK